MKKVDKSKIKLAVSGAVFALSVGTIISAAAANVRRPLLIVAWIAAAASAAYTVGAAREISKETGVPVKRRLASFIKRRFPFAKRGGHDLGKSYVTGQSKTELVISGSLSQRLRSLFDRRKKADPRRAKTERERIRLAFIKRMLELYRGDVDVTATPREASLIDPGSEELFSSYEKIRYGKTD